MLTELQEKKQKVFFKLLDADGDGFISSNDFKGIGENLCIMQGIGLDTSVFRDIEEASEKLWMDIRQYISGEDKGKCDVNGWLAFSDEQIVNSDQAWYDNYINSVVSVLFLLFDSDGDGLISDREFMSIFLSFRVEVRLAAKSFKMLDQNHDGHLAKGELAAAVSDFFRSDDPASNGNHIFGMLP